MNRIKNLVSILAYCALIPMLTGCASVMCGSKQDVAIDSRPRGADVMVYNPQCEIVFQSTTPCVATLNRRAGNSTTGNYIVMIKKEGYAPVQIPLVGRINSAYYLNLLAGCVGFIIDPLTGAMWSLDAEAPDGIMVKDNADFFDHDGVFVSLKGQTDETPAEPVKAKVDLTAAEAAVK